MAEQGQEEPPKNLIAVPNRWLKRNKLAYSLWGLKYTVPGSWIMKKLFFVFLAAWMVVMPMDLGLAQRSTPLLIKNLTKKFIHQSKISWDRSQVTFTVYKAEGYIHEDEDWPIVQREKYTYIDEETGALHIHETIWREAPLGYSSSRGELTPCPQSEVLTVAEQIASPATCTSAGNVSRDDVDTITFSGGSVSHRIKHYAEKFCEGGCANRQLYRLYKVETWWTRTNANSSVQNATLQWGCDVNSADWSAVYSWGPTYVGWSNNTQSHIYVFTNNTWPAVEGLIDQAAKAISRSDVYHGGSKKGSTFVRAAWP